ncbi:hypothetical protein BDV27DRAFT_122398 [Aspergillus caelatus]|uniref:Uncharacterized protein n=2 Tax=Aspergillus subgen. Circumdati TaxID=2720871 RepID=A0A5N7AEP5_9EURO|nr:uncharacterized protein BDV27DRAFT_122398 [Aspergillus caelatus]KAE8368341.1 hypothetical protein BDV27DRAFT_122398 [Aspergillus caelatus]KAE8422618.1 hypothetical protein BDV36DRAFT_244883 [Aspergillus pseudocaelatus]
MKRPLLAMLETYAALSLGGIVHVNMHNESFVTLRALANIPYANEIALLNTSTLAVE